MVYISQKSVNFKMQTFCIHIPYIRPAHYAPLATLAKFGLRAGNMEFNTQKEVLIKIHLITCITLPVYFFICQVQ